jgi:hypothetical protein
MKFIVLSILMGVSFTACTSSSGPSNNSYIYNGIDFGSNRNYEFKRGVQDACHTADGQYTKNRELFNNNISYKTGWEDGRIRCHGK